MARKIVGRPDQPLRETEEAAYHAYREWPLLLVLREKTLAQHLADPTSGFAALPPIVAPPPANETLANPKKEG